MRTSIKVVSLSLALVSAAPLVAQERPIRVPLDPRITPDGRSVVFAWQSDLWLAPLDGASVAHRLTTHLGEDGLPIPSPDGRSILFRSDRAGGDQLFLMSIEGGAARQLTFDGLDRTPVAFFADGLSILVLRRTDRSPFGAEATRPYRLPLDRNQPEQMLFDTGLSDAAPSPDGKRLLFTRLGVEPSRKGFRGSSASQLWIAELAAPAE